REIECLYILNDRGIQIGDTVCGHALSAAISGSMFQPAADRTDQSLKDYYYRRQDMDGDLYISEPYVSLASGSTCITLSLSFSSTANSEYILCVDFIV
ncbi:MAG TPA: PDC sensor domain-containing protein, partial [Armatimonadota bacterium]|nr:PDC sensor domain-containing protein [Armatimonadota bacterium]